MNQSMNRKKKTYYVVCFVLGCMLGFWMAKDMCCKSKRNTPSIYKLVSLREYQGGEYNPKDFYQIDTPSVALTDRKCEGGVVCEPKTAYQIIYSVLKQKYSKEYIDEKMPFEISLINNMVWKVISNDSVICAYLQKQDASILSIKNNEKTK